MTNSIFYFSNFQMREQQQQNSQPIITSVASGSQQMENRPSTSKELFPALSLKERVDKILEKYNGFPYNGTFGSQFEPIHHSDSDSE